MTPQQAKDLLPIITAFAEGKTIQFKGAGITKWKDKADLGFSYPACHYRIKPSPTFRPWTADEVPLGAEVRHKKSGARSLISRVEANGALVSGDSFYTFVTLLRDLTLADGSPCGKVVEE